jgi:hypothetical protein
VVKQLEILLCIQGFPSSKTQQILGFLPFLPLGATAQGELWPPEQSASILLYSSSFLPILSLSFYGDDHVHLPTISAPSLMSITVQSIHLRLIIWFLNNLVFTV